MVRRKRVQRVGMPDVVSMFGRHGTLVRLATRDAYVRGGDVCEALIHLACFILHVPSSLRSEHDAAL